LSSDGPTYENGFVLLFINVYIPIGELGGIKGWNGRDLDVGTEIVILTNVGAFMRFVHIVEEGSFAYSCCRIWME